MLPHVETPIQKLEEYQGIISDELLEEVESLSKNFQGLRVNLVNSTPRGGGVAEILKSLVPLMKGVGIEAEWYTIPAKNNFFKITKEIHNALQAKEYIFPLWDRVRYLQQIENTAFLMKNMKVDLWVIHDPQPAGVILYLPNFHPSILHIHIDLALSNPECWNFFAGIFRMYDRIIISSKEFLKKEIKEKVIISPPAIDPLVEKNQALPLNEAKIILENFGLDPKKPLVSQISRFDPWKDPLGVIEAYRLAKKKIPDLQLALVGLFLAQDDPEAMKIFRQVEKEVKGVPDIFLFSDPNQLGSLKVDQFVNACQVASDIILQKSIREGFGLSLTEAMWKGKAVIGGKAGGIKLQIENNRNGFLVASPKEAGKRIVQLIKNPQLRERLGGVAKETVKEKFLIPRLLRDYLKLFRELVSV